jgi:hypothetical protein
MKAEHRFLRTRDGITRFARVTLSSEPAKSLEIHFAPSLGGLLSAYHDALRAGISAAASQHEKLGGQWHRIHLVALAESAVDTSPDAVYCAAAVAAWKSFGRDEGDALVSFADGQWVVSFRTVAEGW